MKAALEMLSTLFNELSNCDWTFDGKDIEKVVVDDARHELFVSLHQGPMIVIKVEEKKPMGWQYCTTCQSIQPGWPDEWGNVSMDKGLRYACGSCVAKQRGTEPQGETG